MASKTVVSLQALVAKLDKRGGRIEVHDAQTGEAVATIRSFEESIQWGLKAFAEDPDRPYTFLYCGPS